MRLLRRGTAGQAAVETAIVLPLFTFMILGILQMTLVYQARSMLKYAAYRAARTGALQHACVNQMRTSALAALVPVIAWSDNYLPAQTTGQYLSSLMRARFNRYPTGLQIVDVRICNPLQADMNSGYRNGNEVDFDSVLNTTASGSGAAAQRAFERTKLRIQVKYLQHLVIPLANAVVFKAWTGERVADVMRMNDTSGLGGLAGRNFNKRLSFDQGSGSRPDAEDAIWLSMMARRGQYYLPMYANYAFRMQSNFFLNSCPLPQTNRCWHYRASSAR